MNEWFGIVVIPHKEAWARLNFKPDLLVTYQHLWKPSELEAFGARTTVVVPMYDDTPKTKAFWQGYLGFKIVSFSSTLGRQLKDWGHDVLSVQYYPEVFEVRRTTSLRGFFWPRTESLDWSHIRQMVMGVSWDGFHLHLTNPEGRHNLPNDNESEALKMEQSDWYERPEDYLKVLDKTSVYFAPRRLEGIGQSFVEALVRGLCVVAPDAPTMNEYITHGVDGYLYDPESPASLDWSKVDSLGDKAWERAKQGRKAWVESLPTLKAFLTESTPRSHNKFHPFTVSQGKLIALARWLKRRFRKSGLPCPF